MSKDIELNKISLEELILVTGSFIFSGHELSEVDTDDIMKLVEVAEDELELRATGIPKDIQIH